MQRLAPNLLSLHVHWFLADCGNVLHDMAIGELTRLTSLEVYLDVGLGDKVSYRLSDGISRLHSLALLSIHGFGLCRWQVDQALPFHIRLSLPPQLSMLQKLHTVTFTNAFASLGRLSQLPCLQTLCYRETYPLVEDLRIPSSFGRLGNSLTRLDLSWGDIIGTYSSMTELTCLKSLQLYYICNDNYWVPLAAKNSVALHSVLARLSAHSPQP